MAQGSLIQRSQITGAGGTLNATVAPYGNLRVSQELTTLLYDPFDASPDVVTLWNAFTQTAGGTVAFATGTLTLSSSTTISSVASLVSRASFLANAPAFCQLSFAIKLEAQSSNLYTLNGYRFFGEGTVPGTPTPALPLTDAVGFEVDNAGKMWCVVYAAGTKTQVSTGVGDGSLMTTGSSLAPSDNAYHRYIILIRTDRIYWYIDSLDTPVATSSFQAPNVQTLPVRLMALSSTTSQPTQVQILANGVAVADSGKNSTQISDGTYPWRKAGVDSLGNIKTSSVTSTIVHGRKSSIGTSALQITSTSSVLMQGMQILAADTNTDKVYIGNSNVTTDSADATDGIPLAPGDSVFLSVNNANIPYARAASGSTQKVFYMAI